MIMYMAFLPIHHLWLESPPSITLLQATQSLHLPVLSPMLITVNKTRYRLRRERVLRTARLLLSVTRVGRKTVLTQPSRGLQSAAQQSVQWLFRLIGAIVYTNSCIYLIIIIIGWRVLGRTDYSRLHEFSPLGTVLRTLPRGVEAEIVLLEVELNRSKPGSSWSARWAMLPTFDILLLR